MKKFGYVFLILLMVTQVKGQEDENQQQEAQAAATTKSAPAPTTKSAPAPTTKPAKAPSQSNSAGAGKKKLTPEEEKEELLQKDIDAEGKMCITFHNDAEQFGPKLKNLFLKSKEKIEGVPLLARQGKHSDLYDYEVHINQRYDTIHQKCQEHNLRVFRADSEEEVALLLSLMRSKDDRDGTPAQSNDIFWLPLEGNEADQPLYTLSGNNPHVNDIAIKGLTRGLKYVHPKGNPVYTKCGAVEKIGQRLKFMVRRCSNNAAILCVKEKNFARSWAEQIEEDKQEMMDNLDRAIAGSDKVLEYLKSVQSPKCTPGAWTETFSELIKRVFPAAREAERVDRLTMTKTLLNYPQLEPLVNLLNKTSGKVLNKVGDIIQKITLGPFTEITTSADFKYVCICPKVKFLKDLNNFFEKMASLNTWFDFIELDNQIRLPELILTFVTTLALIVAIAGLCIQRRYVKLKEKRQKRKQEKRNRKGILKPMDDKSVQMTPRPKRSVSFTTLFKRSSQESVHSVPPSLLSSSSSSSSPSSSSQSSNDSLNQSSNSGEKIKAYV